MAIVLLRIGTSSGSLVTMPNSPSQEVQITRNKIVNNKITYHGSRIVNITGNNKKILTLQFKEVKDVNFTTFSTYADVVKKWWVQVTGRTGVDIINAFCYVEFSDIVINRVADDALAYDFTLNIYEI
jgi:hypothetical protein